MPTSPERSLTMSTCWLKCLLPGVRPRTLFSPMLAPSHPSPLSAAWSGFRRCLGPWGGGWPGSSCSTSFIWMSYRSRRVFCRPSMSRKIQTRAFWPISQRLHRSTPGCRRGECYPVSGDRSSRCGVRDVLGHFPSQSTRLQCGREDTRSRRPGRRGRTPTAARGNRPHHKSPADVGNSL